MNNLRFPLLWSIIRDRDREGFLDTHLHALGGEEGGEDEEEEVEEEEEEEEEA